MNRGSDSVVVDGEQANTHRRIRGVATLSWQTGSKQILISGSKGCRLGGDAFPPGVVDPARQLLDGGALVGEAADPGLRRVNSNLLPPNAWHVWQRRWRQREKGGRRKRVHEMSTVLPVFA